MFYSLGAKDGVNSIMLWSIPNLKHAPRKDSAMAELLNRSSQEIF
jgi:hypothetical protein